MFYRGATKPTTQHNKTKKQTKENSTIKTTQQSNNTTKKHEKIQQN